MPQVRFKIELAGVPLVPSLFARLADLFGALAAVPATVPFPINQQLPIVRVSGDERINEMLHRPRPRMRLHQVPVVISDVFVRFAN